MIIVVNLTHQILQLMRSKCNYDQKNSIAIFIIFYIIISIHVTLSEYLHFAVIYLLLLLLFLVFLKKLYCRFEIMNTGSINT